MTADYIRLFCQTDGSPVSELAWAFMRRMIRFRPVLIASLSGPQMVGRWVGYEPLRITPQRGTFVNVVCTDPSRWTWIQHVAAPDTPLSAGELAAGDESTAERLSARVELWTAGVRNVLIALAPPRTPPEVATAGKYNMIIVPNLDVGSKFAHAKLQVHVCLHPYGEETVKSLVLGAP